MVLPGWDFSESVKTRQLFSSHRRARAHQRLVALSEIMAFVYAERRDTLAELRDSAAGNCTQEQLLDEANRRHAAEIGGLKTQLADSRKSVVGSTEES